MRRSHAPLAVLMGFVFVLYSALSFGGITTGAQAATPAVLIRQEIERTDSDWDREKLQERLAKLSGGVAVIKVGAATETALKERKGRIEDAVAASIVDGHLSDEDAARKWLDANPAVWRAWLP